METNFKWKCYEGALRHFIYKQCTASTTPIDGWGWSLNLLYAVRSARSSRYSPSFFNLITKWATRIGNAEINDHEAQALSAGFIMAFNKLPEQEQRRRVEQGREPKIRPVNPAPCLLKLVFQFALRSQPAQTALKKMYPTQLGVGAKRGVEIMAHLATAARRGGYAILKHDARNGFNELCRAAAHRAMKKKFPTTTTVHEILQ